MIRSLYQAASAMMAQMARQLTLSNNISNVSTPGYKQTTLAVDDFSEMLLNRISGVDAREIGSLSLAVKMSDPLVDLGQGALVETGRTLDLALAGTGFFTIQTPDGLLYTRDGTFHIDASRQLVTGDGMPVLGEGGPITLPQGEILVEADGTVRVNGEALDRLLLTEFEPDAAVRPVGNNRFAVDQPGRVSETTGVSQGYLEQSNVDLSQSMVDMLAASRSYAIAQRMLQLSDDSLRLAANEIGKVS